MNIRFIVYGIFIALLWKTETGESVILTTTLLTGFMGGFLIGKMTLGTFLGLLSMTGNGNNNATNLNLPSLPTLPSVNLSSIRFPSLPLPSLPSFPALLLAQLEQESLDLPESDISGAVASATTTSTVSPVTPSPTQAPIYYGQPTAPNMPYVYTYNYPVMYPYQSYYTTTTSRPEPLLKLSMIPIKSADVPLSLDNKIRDRFIRQLAIMDPLHCLPKIFCEVTADPLGATYIMDHAAITSVGAMQQPTITKEEIMAYENKLQRQRTTTTPRPPPTTTTTTPAPQADKDEEEQNDSESASEEDDDISASAESGSEEDDSFEQYRKEHEHKIEMQALEEMVDEVEDPEMYMLILRDKQKKKAARKKYREKHRQKTSPLLPSSNAAAASFRGELPITAETETEPYELPPLAYDVPDYQEDPESAFLNRRMSLNGPPPPPSMEPPQFFPPLFTRTTEATLQDMFADDPFFDDFPTSSGRQARRIKNPSKRRAKRHVFQQEDLMRKYRIAYLVAEKYRKPEMCEKTFPSCPYRAETILSVVNRLESGIMPFQIESDKRNYFSNPNNIAHFKNTLQAIERLNKATLQYQARGEPLDIDKLTEVAANPTSSIETNASQNIVNEFQKVVAKIKTAKLKKRKKHKRKKHPKNQTKYDAVHYYKKAQMENLRPKERIKPGLFHAKESVRQQDDEHQVRLKQGELPSFKQTYKEMFKVSKVKAKKGKPPANNRRKTNIVSTDKPTTEVKPVRKFSGVTEDDEQDAKESEEAINALIVQGKPRSGSLLRRFF